MGAARRGLARLRAPFGGETSLGFWDGKVAVITGSAGGIGRASALLFVERGARVVVSDLNEAGGEETVKLAGGPEHATFVGADTTSAADAAHLMEAAVSAFGGIDVLVNDAAILHRHERIEDVPLESFLGVINVNLNGGFIVTQAAVPYLKQRGGGVIVNMSSMGARGGPNILSYSAAKAGVLALTRGLSAQLEPFNIRVNALMPGLVETPMTVAGPAIENARRAGAYVFRPEEMARAVAYCAEHEELNGASISYSPTLDGPQLSIQKEWEYEPLTLD